MVVPWHENPGWKYAKVGKQIAVHDFCKWLYRWMEKLMPDLILSFLFVFTSVSSASSAVKKPEVTHGFKYWNCRIAQCGQINPV